MPECPEHRSVIASLERIEAQLDRIATDQARTIRAVCGDLEGQQAGLLHRVATLEAAKAEQEKEAEKLATIPARVKTLEAAEATRTRAAWVCITAAVGAAISAVGSFLHRG